MSTGTKFSLFKIRGHILPPVYPFFYSKISRVFENRKSVLSTLTQKFDTVKALVNATSNSTITGLKREFIYTKLRMQQETLC